MFKVKDFILNLHIYDPVYVVRYSALT